MDGLAMTDDAFGPLAPVRLADGVLAALSQAILDGRLKPGESLPSEATLAARFGVSKQVVREAVRQLAALGAVQIGQGRATRVVEMTDAQPLARFWRFAVGSTREGLAEAVELRRILEPQVARLAALHATADGVARLRDALKRMEAALGDVPAWIPADLDFHEQLGRMSGNRLVRLQVQGLRPVLEEVLRHFNSAQRSKADWQRTLARHRRVADAVAARDADAAFAAMLEHFKAADARLTQLFPRGG
ncbi:FadR/GntR family transcriptional regulator [Falsiroseomonas sp. HW251]|uniref:FadR/GntR family transcriptional regulator n=1 Tax=Falsiroseomonas sp. HW251 TaxID=3390998 RepID=UPI003D316950